MEERTLETLAMEENIAKLKLRWVEEDMAHLWEKKDDILTELRRIENQRARLIALRNQPTKN